MARATVDAAIKNAAKAGVIEALSEPVEQATTSPAPSPDQSELTEPESEFDAVSRLWRRCKATEGTTVKVWKIIPNGEQSVFQFWRGPEISQIEDLDCELLRLVQSGRLGAGKHDFLIEARGANGQYLKRPFRQSYFCSPSDFQSSPSSPVASSLSGIREMAGVLKDVQTITAPPTADPGKMFSEARQAIKDGVEIGKQNAPQSSPPPASQPPGLLEQFLAIPGASDLIKGFVISLGQPKPVPKNPLVEAFEDGFFDQAAGFFRRLASSGNSGGDVSLPDWKVELVKGAISPMGVEALKIVNNILTPWVQTWNLKVRLDHSPNLTAEQRKAVATGAPILKVPGLASAILRRDATFFPHLVDGIITVAEEGQAFLEQVQNGTMQDEAGLAILEASGVAGKMTPEAHAYLLRFFSWLRSASGAEVPPRKSADTPPAPVGVDASPPNTFLAVCQACQTEWVFDNEAEFLASDGLCEEEIKGREGVFCSGKLLAVHDVFAGGGHGAGIGPNV